MKTVIQNEKGSDEVVFVSECVADEVYILELGSCDPKYFYKLHCIEGKWYWLSLKDSTHSISKTFDSMAEAMEVTLGWRGTIVRQTSTEADLKGGGAVVLPLRA